MIGKAFLAGLCGDGGQHIGRQVRSRDSCGVRRKRVGHVASATAEIQCMLWLSLNGDHAQGLEIGALRMDSALDIRLRTRAELGFDDAVMVLGHAGPLRAMRSRMDRFETVTMESFILLSFQLC